MQEVQVPWERFVELMSESLYSLCVIYSDNDVVDIGNKIKDGAMIIETNIEVSAMELVKLEWRINWCNS